MNHLISPLLHFVWQGTLISATLWIALRFTRHHRTRYALASAALLLMALAPITSYGPAASETELLRPMGTGGPHAQAIVWVAQPSPLAWLPYAWLAGVVLCSVRVVRAAAATHRLLRHAHDVPHLRPHFFDRAVRLVESARVTVPAQLGILRPVILLPLGFAAQLSPAQLEAILAHEFAHIRRHDYLVNLLQLCVETLLFYHPGVWWVSSIMRREREHCADALALELTGDRHAYASALLTLEETRQAGFATAANGGDLKARIERILAGGTAQRGSLWPAVLALVVAFGYTAVTRAQQPAAEPATLRSGIEEVQTEQELAAKFDAHLQRQQAEKQAKAERAARDHEMTRLKDEIEELRAQLHRAETRAGEAGQEARRADERAEQRRLEAALQRQQQALEAEQETRALAQLKQQMQLMRAAQEDQTKAQETEHKRRVQYADKKWSVGNRRGSETARGRMYVQEGPPDEIEIQTDKREMWLYRTSDGPRIHRFDSEGNLVK